MNKDIKSSKSAARGAAFPKNDKGSNSGKVPKPNDTPTDDTEGDVKKSANKKGIVTTSK